MFNTSLPDVARNTAITLVAQHDAWLVVLSITVAIVASVVALAQADAARHLSTDTLRRLHVLSGALALAGGIWAMHFIGMLALRLPVTVSFHGGLTLLSFFPALLASFVAVQVLARPQVAPALTVLAGAAVGLGIATMHFVGMAAIQSPLELRYDPLLFLLSVVLAVGLAAVALVFEHRVAIRHRSRGPWWRALAAALLGLAIAGMHYTAMHAAIFRGVAPTAPGETHVETLMLALLVALVTLVTSLLVAAGNALSHHHALLLQSRQTASELETMLDTTPDAIFRVDTDGVILSANAAATSLFHQPPSVLAGRPISLLLDAGRLLDPMLDTDNPANGQPRVFETNAQRAGGDRFPVRVSVGIYGRASRRQLVVLVSDLSGTRAVERALHDSEQQYRTLIGNLPGVAFRCLWDARWTPLYISDHIRDLTGWEPADFMSGSISLAELIHDDDERRSDREMRRAAQEGVSYALEYRIRHRQGHWRWVEETATPVSDDAGNIRWIDGILLDITDRHLMETEVHMARQQAEESVKAKSAFLANMSHEIRTPMNAIIGFTELVLESPLTPSQTRNLGIVHSSARTLLGLLNDILDTAKLDSGTTQLEQRNFSLRRLCEQIVATQSLLAGRKALQLVLHYHVDVGDYFVGDPLRLQQVILNLVNNAVKFTEKGKVTVRVRPARRRQGVRIYIEDTGVGIPRDRLDRIFEPFSQVDSSVTRRYGGTGLGTTIARQLVELMGGTIRVASQEGEGTSFRLFLPLRQGIEGTAEDQPRRETGLPPLRILVADDVDQNIELIAALLGPRLHTLVTASNGEEAVEHARHDSFDVILMDVQMPVLNGLEACREIRRHEQELGRKATPVIALTASVMESDRRAARDAGMDGFVAKPLELGELTAEIARVLGHETPEASALAMNRHDRIQPVDHERVARVWGDPQAHWKALKRFLDDPGNRPDAIASMLPHAPHKAAALTHRLRGVAGNLCLPGLANALDAVQQQLDADGAGSAGPSLQDVVEAFLAVRQTARPPGDGQPDAEGTLPATVDPARLAALMKRLEAGEMPMEELHSMRGALPEDYYRQAVQAMEHFDAGAALKSLAMALQR